MDSASHTSGSMFVYAPGMYVANSDKDPDYSTTGTGNVLYRHVSLESYPSSYDFFDPVDTVSPGDIGIILRTIGLPWQIILDKKLMKYKSIREKYTLYEACVAGEIVQIFGNDIKPLEKNKA